MVGGVIWQRWGRWVALVTADLHGVARHAAADRTVAADVSAADHGAMACRGVSVRMKISRP